MGPILYTADALTTIGYREASFEEIMTAARKALAAKVRKGAALTSPSVTRDYLMTRLAEREYEVFCVIHLDNRHRVIEIQELFRGTVDGASVYPREVVKEALDHNASAVILAHNHPSSVCEPSHADRMITTRLREALAMVDIRVLDHFIVGGPDVLSFSERGLL